MSRRIVAEAGRPVSTDGSAAGGSEEGARGNFFDGLIVGGELSRLLTKQAKNAC